MTEDEARALLRAGDRDGLEAWIAGQPWTLMPGDWWRAEGKDGGHFDLLPAPKAIRVIANLPDGAAPVVWLVMA